MSVAHGLGSAGASPEQLRAEAAAELDERVRVGDPYVWTGIPSAVSGAYDDIQLAGRRHRHRLGARARRRDRPQRVSRIGTAEALDYVAGYTIVNDLTARSLVPRDDMAKIGTDWFRAKNQPGFFPTGPWLVPARFVPDPTALRMRLTLNGEIKQDATTGDLAFDVPALLSYASSVAILQPGDLLITGSPAGNGSHWKRFLRRWRRRGVDDRRARHAAKPRARADRRASPVAGGPGMTLRQSQFVPPVPLIVARELGLLDSIDLEARRTSGSPRAARRSARGRHRHRRHRDRQPLRVDCRRSRRASRGADRGDHPARHLRETRRRIASRISREAGSRWMPPPTASRSWRGTCSSAKESPSITSRSAASRSVSTPCSPAMWPQLSSGRPSTRAALDANASLLATVAETLPAFPGPGTRREIRAHRLGGSSPPTCTRSVWRLDAAERMTDAEGEELLERAGFGTAAAATWASRPRTLEVDPDGLTLLAEIRSELRLMPPGIRLEDLHDPTPLHLAVSRHPTR